MTEYPQVESILGRRNCESRVSMIDALAEKKQEAYEQAIDSLSRYKFMMFGYWSAIWVHL